MISSVSNPAASQALQALAAANSATRASQAELASGRTVDGAKDDPATWAIAQTIRGEAAAMTAASDSLSRGQSLADVATAGASQISDLLSQFRAKWLSFSDPSIAASDRKALQSDLQSLLKQVDLVAQDSSFDGATPLLAMTSDASTPSTAVIANQRNALA